MEKNSLIIIVMATMLEAKPFVDGLSLTEIHKKPFLLFGNNRFYLIISGIGKANAAMATAYCCEKFKPACIFNMGAAGATGFSCSMGEKRLINKIYEVDRPVINSGMPHLHQPDILDGFATSILVTTDRPILNKHDRDAASKYAELVDMEGAAVVQACRKFETMCFVFKFVSDTPGHTEGKKIVDNIKKYRDDFYVYYNKSVLPAVLSNQIYGGGF